MTTTPKTDYHLFQDLQPYIPLKTSSLSLVIVPHAAASTSSYTLVVSFEHVKFKLLVASVLPCRFGETSVDFQLYKCLSILRG